MSDVERLPDELLQRLLSFCSPKQIAALETSCRQFYTGRCSDYAARVHLNAIPWACCLIPEYGETWVTLLRYACSKNLALPQATAISLGSSHTAVILSVQSDGQNCLLATFGSAMLLKMLSLPFGHHAVVACGGMQSAVITRRGELYVWGQPPHADESFGSNATSGNCVPTHVIIQNGIRIVGLCQGSGHMLAISENYQLLASGKNSHGQLGIASCRDCSSMEAVNMGQQPIASVAAGDSHSLALGFDGTVWGWGLGKDGQLGHELIARVAKETMHFGRPIVLHEPKRIVSLNPENLLPHERISGIAAGGNHSIVLTLGGKIMTFGGNEYGCLGTGDHESCFVPTKVELNHLAMRHAPVRALQVACGRHHTLVLAQCGGETLVCSTGLNDQGQLGLGDFLPRTIFHRVSTLAGIDIAAIASGDHHCAAISTSGQLFMWGCGDSGQLGCGLYCNMSVPVTIPGRVIHPSSTLGFQEYCKRDISSAGAPEPSAPAMELCSLPSSDCRPVFPKQVLS